MTNYDRWKLATPDYLEDTDADLQVHDTDADAGSWSELREIVQTDGEDAGKRSC